jgi:peroxiredoxin/cytidylate kinase
MGNKINIGDKAPNFILPDAENRKRTLKEFLGQKVVLVFFVGAFTQKCTKERCEFRDSISQLINLKAQIIGIDVTVPSSTKVVAKKNKLPFPILSDYKREVIETYGLEAPSFPGQRGSVACCWGKGCFPLAKRSIFILDEKGVVQYMWVSDNPEVEPDFEQVSKILKQDEKEGQGALAEPTVITISRQVGSDGDEIALKVSEILGYAYFDKTLMFNEAKSINVSEEDIADFSEDDYKVKSFVDKILIRKKPITSLSSKDDAQIRKTLDVQECLSVIQTVINSLASRGKTVIVGRGGQAILKNKAGVLNVRIVAPLVARVKRIMKSEGLSQEAAQKLIEENDKAAAEYLRKFYNTNVEDPTIYDLVLNTEKMDPTIAAKAIVSVASQPHRMYLSRPKNP